MEISTARELVVKAGIRLVESGLIAGTWGNVSCRISDDYFVITPSGRDYVTLDRDEIVKVKISDCSYTGDIKPSSEKGMHAEIYRLFPEANFVIHTHQENASVISACSLDSIKPGSYIQHLGDEIVCASYALPGTKGLRRNVAAALSHGKGKAVIMKNHGAICYGSNCDEAFMAAFELEKACEDFIKNQYLKSSKSDIFDSDKMINYALPPLSKNNSTNTTDRAFYKSCRTERGFELFNEDDKKIEIQFNMLENNLPMEAAIYNAIYDKYNNINYIVNAVTPEIKALSLSGLSLKPLLDDFAQIAGTRSENVELNIPAIVTALKNSSVVLVREHGALCCGKSEADADAAAMVTQKAAKALIGASLFGRVKPINPLECMLMRFVYLKKYSKQKYTNHK